MSILLENFEAAPAADQWQQGSAKPDLAAGDIHIWRAQLDAERPAMDTLSAAEIIRAARGKSARDRGRRVTARVFLREVLARYFRVEAHSLELGASPFHTSDAPVYSSPERGTLRFLLSETENLALLAVTRASRIGIGVERVREDLPFDEMARHFFEPEEQWNLRTTFARSQKARKFFDFWTTSEARTKAAPMQTSHTPISLHRLAPAPGFLAAVAVAGTAAARLSLWDWR